VARVGGESACSRLALRVGPTGNRCIYHDWAALEIRGGGNTVIESYTDGPDMSGALGGVWQPLVCPSCSTQSGINMTARSRVSIPVDVE